MTFRYEATGFPSLCRPLNPCSNDQLTTERFLHLRGQCHGGRFGLVDPGLGGHGSRGAPGPDGPPDSGPEVAIIDDG